MVVYLELVEVWGRENDRGVFLWLAGNIIISVTGSYVIGTCRTDVLASVFCNVMGSIEFEV
jgi:hypothetical protein